MKKYQLFAGLAIAFLLVSFSGNPPVGNTGAPFDNTCSQSGCHTGTSTIMGSVNITGIPDDVEPGMTYPFKVVLQVTGGSASRGGFQMVAVNDNNNNNSGTIQNIGSNTDLDSKNGRTYLDHQNAKNFNGSTVEYNAEWVAPQVMESESTTFYVGAILANGNGSTSGDRFVLNSLSVNVVVPNMCEVGGGTLVGGPFEFCAGDGQADKIALNEITLTDNNGSNSRWVVTDENGKILGLPVNDFTDVDFDGAGAGTCSVMHLSHEDDLTGLEMGANISGLQGCFEFSNSISVVRVTSGGVCPPPPETFTFVATLAGSQEVPAFNSPAMGTITGVLTGNSLSISGSFNGLSGDFAANIAGGSHIHMAPAGRNGGIALTLTVSLDADAKGGSYQAEDNTFDLTDEQAQNLKNRYYYVNIHTAASNSGELRGQLLPQSDSYLATSLSGSNLPQPTGSEGVGNIVIEISGTTMTVTGGFTGLTGDFGVDIAGGSHIHNGDAASSGGIEFAMAADLDEDKKGGKYTAANNTFELTMAQATALATGQNYVNIHSTTVNSGEIRGQILGIANKYPTGGFGITAPVSGSTLEIADDATIAFSTMWNSTTDPDGDLVVYTWQMSFDEDFANIALESKVGTATTFATTTDVINGMLEAEGVAEGGSATIFHRAIASDGSVSTKGMSGSFTATRAMAPDPSDCNPPSEIVSEVLSDRTFSVTWSRVSNARAYFIRIRFAGKEKFLIRARVRGRKVFVFGPTSRAYEFQIQSECEDGSLSEYSDIITVSTAKSLRATNPIFYDGNAEVIQLGISGIEKLRINPNPAFDHMNISYTGNENTEMILFSLDGKELVRRRFKAGYINKNVDLQHFDSGVYILQIISDSGLVRNERIIKMRR
ncbi:MAG: CHRD domain-containing protein [Saprospiraceae bacterium]